VHRGRRGSSREIRQETTLKIHRGQAKGMKRPRIKKLGKGADDWY